MTDSRCLTTSTLRLLQEQSSHPRPGQTICRSSLPFKKINYRNLPIDSVLVSLPNVGYSTAHDMIRSGIDMVRMIRVHRMVQMGRMMETLQSRPVSDVGLVQRSCCCTVHVSWMDSIVVLQREKMISDVQYADLTSYRINSILWLGK